MHRSVQFAWLLTATTALAFAARWKLGIAANWVPPIPSQIGVWIGRRQTLPEYEHAVLARPNYVLMQYADPFGNRVNALIVSATSRHTFHDPRDCGVGSGFVLTGTRRVPLGGPGEFARGMVFRKRGAQLIMLYWMQGADKKAFAPSVASGGYLAPIRSSWTVWKATATGHPINLVRVYAVVPPEDEGGQETLQNILEIAQAVYQAIKSAS